MTDSILDVPLRVVYNTDDPRILHRACEALIRDQGIPFLEALKQLDNGVDGARANRGATLRDAIEWTRSTPEDFENVVKMLDRRDEAVRRTLERELASTADVETDAQGRVMLDAPSAGAPASGGTDIGTALTDPAERERRLARARQFDAQYKGSDGRKLFDQIDREHLEAGRDLLSTWEHEGRVRAAQAKAQAVSKQLDQAIGKATDKRQQLRLLETEIAKLAPNEAGVREVVADQLRAQAVDATSDTLKLLDQAVGAVEPRLLSIDEAIAREDALGKDSHYVALTRRRDELKRDPKANYQQLVVLDAALDRRKQELSQPATPPAPETPPGVHPGSHQLAKRVRALMAERGLKERDYNKALEAVLREDAQ